MLLKAQSIQWAKVRFYLASPFLSGLCAILLYLFALSKERISSNLALLKGGQPKMKLP
jgi:hypothetical protein